MPCFFRPHFQGSAPCLLRFTISSKRPGSN
jgi:hypothetical protein